ncbi:MAG TPA: DNA repair protein RadA [Planctomycetota bacterium]|nr:DNA repair protein RadA [Planctomycetota bacterium]
MKTKKARTAHRCRECGFETAQWQGRCPSCESWQTLELVTLGAPRSGRAQPAAQLAAPLTGERFVERAHELSVAFLGEVDALAAVERMPCGLREVDRVLGGGLVPGSGVLLGGDPGIGKSTLVLQLAYSVAAGGRRVLYVSGEEQPAQLKLRAERLGFLPSAGERAPVLVQGVVEVERVLEALELRPDLIIVDSMQVLRMPESDSSPGSVSQVRDVAHALVEAARKLPAALLLVGHVTKEGTIAGPRVVEHLVDQVLSLEGEPGSALRILRSSKNRFGDATETGVLEMTARGLVDVENPSVAFLRGRARGAPGSCVTASREGNRSYLVEVQALATERAFAAPVRRVTGVESGRAAQVIAVLEKRAGLVFREQDVFLNVTSGARIREPAADAAIAVACASSLLSRQADDAVFFGELGLGGEIRAVPGTRSRLAEAARLGFRRAIVPTDVDASDSVEESLESLEVVRVARVEELIRTALA